MKRKLLALPLCLFLSPLIAQFHWQHTNGPEGAVYSYIFNNETHAFYSDDYFLYRSSDGYSWEKLPHGKVWPIAAHSGVLAAQRGRDLHNFGNQPTVFSVSHDNGETWQDGVMPPGMTNFQSLAFCSHGIYVLDEAKKLIFRSEDEGLTWDTIIPPMQYGYEIYGFDDRVYLASIYQVYRTDTDGQNWVQCSPQFGPGEFVRKLIAFGPNLIISTEKKLWHSNDDGNTWASQNNAWPNIYDTFARDGDVVYGVAGSNGVRKTTDFGQTWNYLSAAAPWNPGLTLIGVVNHQLLGTTHDRGIYRFDALEEQFVPANAGLQSARILQLAPAGNKLWANTATGLFGFDKPQMTWDNSPGLPPSYLSPTLSANETGMVARGDDLSFLISISNDYGQSWTDVPWPVDPWGSTNGDLKILDGNIFAGNYWELYRSGDVGLTWAQLPSPIKKVYKFKSLYLSNDQNTIWASNDQGITWAIHSTIPGADIWGIYPAGDLLFAFMSTPQTKQRVRVHTSTDGISWKYAHDGLPDLNFSYNLDLNEQAAYFGYGGKYFIYHPSVGFFASKDTCKTWVLAELHPYSTVVMSDSVFYSGGFGGGVFSASIPDIYGSTASGMVYLDDNNNGIPDAGESPLPGISIGLDAPNSWSPFYSTNTNTNGQYVLAATPSGTDTVRPLIQSNYLESINPPYYLVGNGGTNLDFGVKLTANVHDLSITGNYVGRPRPGFILPISVRYKNVGSVNQDAVVSVKLDPNLTFVDAVPLPTAVFGDSLVWAIPQLAIFSGENILVKAKVSASAQLGTKITSNCRISSITADFAPADNLHILSDTIVGAYDPNEKRVEPADGLTVSEIAAGRPLMYTVQFQNTGTAEAERVRITDMIDTALYWPSLRFESASHPVHTFRLSPSGLLEIIFDDIMLPDSNANEAGSHGYVSFSVQRKKAYKPNYIVRNKAAIYFDYNEPIFTNLVVSPLKSNSVAVQNPIGIEFPALNIYPNPAREGFNVSAENRLAGTGQLSIFNTAGQLCLHRPIVDLSQPIFVQTARLPAGVYFVRLYGMEKALVGKVVVRKGD